MNESSQASADFKIDKNGRKYPAKRVKTSEAPINEASYRGNIGIMELVKFHKIASPKDKQIFNNLMKSKSESKPSDQKMISDKIWDHVQRVTGTKLHQMENIEQEYSLISLYENIGDHALEVLAYHDINASVKDGKIHVHDHSQIGNAKKILSRIGVKHDVVKSAVDQRRKRLRESIELLEKKLTPKELKKREEIALAIEKKYPDIKISKKMAIATATAKKVTEDVEFEKLAENYVEYQDLCFAEDIPTMTFREFIVEMKKDREIVVKLPKPRDPNHLVLAAKKNAAGKHTDKKRMQKQGVEKHKSQSERHVSDFL